MHVSKITIGRLFNLGNYEHVRYEIAADLQPGENPREAAEKITAAINAIGEKPPVDEHQLTYARETLAKPEPEAPDPFGLSREDAQKIIDEALAYKERQRIALENFEKMNGTATN